MKRVSVLIGLVSLIVATAMAQSEGDLKRYFEGRKVRVMIDMPATDDGVDVYPEHGQPLDVSRYAGRLKQFGFGIKEGESVMITKVHVKGKYIEFQLGGGGYGTTSDALQGIDWSGLDSAGKSKKEERLENDLQKETDKTRRSNLKEEIDTLRREREAENRRLQAERATSIELGKQRIEDHRSHGGSRFNIHFDSSPASSQLTPETVMKVLSEYVEFPWVAERSENRRDEPLANPAVMHGRRETKAH